MNSVWSKHLKLIIIEALQISSIKHRLERYMFCHLSYQSNEWLCLVDKGNARRMRVRERERVGKRLGKRGTERESNSKIQYDMHWMYCVMYKWGLLQQIRILELWALRKHWRHRVKGLFILALDQIRILGGNSSENLSCIR